MMSAFASQVLSLPSQQRKLNLARKSQAETGSRRLPLFRDDKSAGIGFDAKFSWSALLSWAPRVSKGRPEAVSLWVLSPPRRKKN